MKVWDELRQLVFLRRIARASERQAVALEQISAVVTDNWSRDKIRPKPKQVEIDLFDVDEANAKWAKQQELAEQGIELDDEG